MRSEKLRSRSRACDIRKVASWQSSMICLLAEPVYLQAGPQGEPGAVQDDVYVRSAQAQFDADFGSLQFNHFAHEEYLSLLGRKPVQAMVELAKELA